MIYLVSTDGYRDSILLDAYATDEAGIKRIIDSYQANVFLNDVRDMIVDFNTKTVTFEYKLAWENDWEKETYTIFPIRSIY